MRDPTIESVTDVEEKEAAGVDEPFELDDVRETKGGPGISGDGMGGLWF